MNSRLSLTVLAGAVALGAAPLAANAAYSPSLSSEAQMGFFDGTSTNFGALVGSMVCDQYHYPSGATGNCSGSATAPNNTTTVDYTSTATADYGVLKAGGTLSTSNAPGTVDTTVYAQAGGQTSFTDLWTITGGTGTGTLTLQFTLDGTSTQVGSSTGYGIGFSLYNYTSQTYSPNPNIPDLINAGTFSKTFDLTTPFTFGSQFAFIVSLDASANIFDLGTSGLSSIFNLSDTATMTQIIVQNSNGAVVPFDLSTGSGASLFSSLAPGIPSTTVPEPATLALVGLGLAGLAMSRRKSKPVA